MSEERAARLGFDGLFLGQPMTGAGQYATHLWEALQRDAEPFDVRLLAPPEGRVRGKARKLAWEQLGLPREARRTGVDLVHVPYFAAPMWQAVPHVVTIHDVIPLVLPEYGGSTQMRAYLRLVIRTSRRARLIVTDSRHARDDIERVLGIPSVRLRVVPLAASKLFQPAVTAQDELAVEAVRRRHQLTRPFVLNVGGYDRRKQLPDLVRGFAAALPRLEEPVDLVIVGAPHTDNIALYPPLEPLVRELGLRERVRAIGFVNEEDKRDLCRAASVFAFTSAYEGFGLTPLEAMACGAPVICSNRTSLPEVVGDAGLLIDPRPEAIAAALVTTLTDPALRADLARRSVARAALFSWRVTADQTLAVYREALTTPDDRRVKIENKNRR